jgi:thiamine biosynthesis lipoprotein
MGTFVEITVPDTKQGRAGSDAVTGEFQRIEEMTSFHKPSDLSRFNDSAGTGFVETPPELFRLLTHAAEMSKLTVGAYDPTVGALTRLWRFSGSDEPRIPTEAEIAEALTRVGPGMLQLDPATGRAALTVPGAAVDLGGIVKGYALTSARKILMDRGISPALVNIGGDITTLGEKAPGIPWRIGVEHPREKPKMMAVLDLNNKTIITSGDYERFFIKDGIRRHHILDPKTGYPTDTVRSVTIVGPPDKNLQPFGTAVFVLGPEKGSKLIEHELPGAGLLIIDHQGKPRMNEAGAQVFEMKIGVLGEWKPD